MALNVLKVWPRSVWPDGAERFAKDLADADPNDRVRRLAADVLSESGGVSTPET